MYSIYIRVDELCGKRTTRLSLLPSFLVRVLCCVGHLTQEGDRLRCVAWMATLSPSFYGILMLIYVFLIRKKCATSIPYSRHKSQIFVQ